MNLPLQLKILWYLNQNDEAVYFYRGLEEYTKASRKELQKEMIELKALGLVELVRGLISEDGGGYYGSGHMITSAGKYKAPQEEPAI